MKDALDEKDVTISVPRSVFVHYLEEALEDSGIEGVLLRRLMNAKALNFKTDLDPFWPNEFRTHLRAPNGVFTISIRDPQPVPPSESGARGRTARNTSGRTSEGRINQLRAERDVRNSIIDLDEFLREQSDSPDKKSESEIASDEFNELKYPYTDENYAGAIGPTDVDDEQKKFTSSITPVFEGTLGRESMAEALEHVMHEEDLSVRGAADAADAKQSVISRIKDGSASLDKSAEVLRALGYEMEVKIYRPEF